MAIQLPALDIQPPQQQPGVLDQYAKVSQLKSLLNQQTLQQQAITEGAQNIKDQQATTAAMHAWDGKSLEDLPGLMLKNGASSTAVLKAKSQILTQRKEYSDIAKNDAETGSKNFETLQKKNDAQLGILQSATSVPDAQLHQSVASIIPQAVQNGIIDPQHAQGLAQMLQSTPDPTALRQQLGLLEKGLMGGKEQFEQAQKQAETQAKVSEAASRAQTAQTSAQRLNEEMPGGKLYKPSETELQVKATQGDPEAAKTISRINANKVNVAGAEASARTKATLAAGAGLAPEAVDLAAQKFLQTGQLIQGMRSPAMAKQVMNRAAELGAGQNLAGNSAAYAANKKSYEQATGTMDTLTAFENVGMKNLDNFLNLAQKIPDTGVPWLNKPVRTLSKDVVGDTNMPAINAARTVALREIARITNDPKLKGVLTDSARQEVEGLIPENATLPQIVAVAKVLKQDVANVHSSVAAQKQAIGERLGIKGNTQIQQQDNTPGGKEIHYKVVNGQLVAQ